MANSAPPQESELAQIIAPEIKDDEFYRLIEKLSVEEKLDYVLELGSSAGGGSTGAFLAGLARNPSQPRLFCVEISKARFAVLQEALAPYPFACCYNMSTVRVDEFPHATDVIHFYNNVPTGLNSYPLSEVLRWLQQDIDYVRDAGVAAGAIAQIKSDHNIRQFDLVLIDGSEFTGEVEFAKIDGARIILLDDTNTYKCHRVRQHLLDDPDYDLIVDNQDLRNGFSAFRRRDGKSRSKDLPIHFFTIVLNGEPFIRYHEPVFASLKVRWHWHIIEGVAALKHDTAWSVETGGQIPEGLHDQGRSNDGTSAYLDELVGRHPNRITVYRKPLDEIWDGKREMVGAPLPNIDEDCLLWQIDSDELWTKSQIETVHDMFVREPDRTAAAYWCIYFVGPRKIISTRFNYAQNPKQEWLRTWRYRPGDFWLAHEPPMLARGGQGLEPVDIAEINPFSHNEMERAGAVFQHFAYVLESQLAFKESYYGYKNAQTQWRNLQSQARPGLLRDYLKWVEDETVFDDMNHYRIDPLAYEDDTGNWAFHLHANAVGKDAPKNSRLRSIVLDGMIWQYPSSERRRFWENLLREWVRTGFAENVTVLDRAGTAPRMEGIHFWTTQRHKPDAPGNDSIELERICRMFGTNLFISSGDTSPTTTPSVLLSFGDEKDIRGVDIERNHALVHAASHILMSQASRTIDVGQCPARHASLGVPMQDSQGDSIKTSTFRADHGLDTKPYVILAGDGKVTQSAKATIAAIGLLAPDQELALLTSIDPTELGGLASALAPKADIRSIASSDDTFLAALAGAHACVCIAGNATATLAALEACSYGCPAIIVGERTADAILSESVFVVGDENPLSIADVLTRLLKPDFRCDSVRKGLEAARLFPIERSAAEIAAALLAACEAQRDGADKAAARNGWSALREHQKRIEDSRRVEGASSKPEAPAAETTIVPQAAALGVAALLGRLATKARTSILKSRP